MIAERVAKKIALDDSKSPAASETRRGEPPSAAAAERGRVFAIGHWGLEKRDLAI